MLRRMLLILPVLVSACTYPVVPPPPRPPITEELADTTAGTHHHSGNCLEGGRDGKIIIEHNH